MQNDPMVFYTGKGEVPFLVKSYLFFSSFSVTLLLISKGGKASHLGCSGGKVSNSTL